MNERFRIYAAIALTSVLVVAGGLFFIGHSSASSAPPVDQIKPLHPGAKATVALAPPKAAMTKAKAGAKKTLARRPAVIAGVPTPLVEALKRHSVVVLALVAPKSEVDSLTLAEAKAGAATAHAGFATIDVGNNAQVEALSALVGTSADAQNRLLDDPAVLVFQKPQALYVRLNGYVDADTVEQAAVNAAQLSTAR
ncbi:MAG: hypothetical protein E6G19_07090 [Actinobacteria bacterium]|nr:MAG: hypothetical protein E6G19_07090 [Actinomycetota bacterium]